MGKRGLGQGLRALVTLLVAVGSIVSSAPAAYAHGGHGAAPAALFEQAGPYVVSVWVEEFADRTMSSSVLIEGQGTDNPPEMWLQSAQGRSRLRGLVEQQDGTWTVQFDSRAGDTFVIGWTEPNGNHQFSVVLRELPAPWWFRSILWLVAPPGLWFGYWLLKRRRRAFGLTPAAT